jgi:hypothetical protein
MKKQKPVDAKDKQMGAKTSMPAYAKGGSVRGSGCERQGKTKGKFV